MKKTITILLAIMFVGAFVLSAIAQPWPHGPGPRPPYGPGPRPPFGPGPRPPYGPPPPPPPHHYHGPSDFDKAMGIVGAVAGIAAIANGQTVYSYNRCARPVVVVERPVVIEKPVVVERTVPVVQSNDYYYSRKLGASFDFQKMQIPGYKFVGARLMSTPLQGSPLYHLGLEKGDVLTRLDDDHTTSPDVLETHQKTTTIRYIKSGTTKVQIDQIYIPTDFELQNAAEDDGYAAP